MPLSARGEFPKWIALLAALLIIACFYYLSSIEPIEVIQPWPVPQVSGDWSSISSTKDAHHLLNPDHHDDDDEPEESPFAAMYKPLKPTVDQKNWQDWRGNEYALKTPARFASSIGKHIAIVDVDSRNFPILKDDYIEWGDVDARSAGVLNHYLYAKIHGYDYRFLKMPSITDRHDTWLKVAGIAQNLREYQFIVFIDNDATFANLELPLEWMLNYWNIHENITLAVSDAPQHSRSQDAHGGRMANTGFIIAQNIPLTHELMKDWADCPEKIDYRGCARFRHDFPHEQGALSDFIRYDPRFTETIVRLSCDETNGRSPDPKVAPPSCEGKLIKHWWASKRSTKPQLQQTIMRDIIRMAQQPGLGLSGSVQYLHEGD